MFAHYDLTLDASIQSLLDAVSPGSAVGGVNDVPCRSIILQADDGNSNLIFVGGANQDVSASSHAFQLAIPVTSIPEEPRTIGGFDTGPLRLSDFRVLGTNAEVLHIGIIPY